MAFGGWTPLSCFLSLHWSIVVAIASTAVVVYRRGLMRAVDLQYCKL